MMLPWASLNTHQRLASIAGALGFLAIFAGSPYSVRIDDLAREAAVAPRIDALKLATSIRDQTGLRVIDVRDSVAFVEYHIPSASHTPLERLGDAQLGRNDRLALYADNDGTALAAWMILRSRGMRDVTILAGGLDAWLRDVMEPWLALDATPEQTRAFEETAAIARYFGGRPRRGIDPALVAERNANAGSAPTATRTETLRRVRRSCGVR